MLPLSAGTLILTDSSREKLDSFFRRFCEGENGRRYGIAHIFYACHAAFPLLLSPALANLLWLNFKNFPVQDNALNISVIQIDPVVVSDLLLSPLVRPVASRQYELIPEIRTYLLYLLKDGRWFRLYGVTSLGPARLKELARFLLQYLDNKRAQNENTGFQQVNRWAAMAYLQPDQLALHMSEAFRATFKGKDTNELGQLRLNLLIDRFGEQYEMDLKEQSAPSKAFMNLRIYSKANNAMLFDQGQTVVSDILATLNEDFIGEMNSGNALVKLPVEKEIGKRLKRKKNKVQRIVSLLIGVDTYLPPAIPLKGCVYGARQVDAFLQHLNAEEFETEATTLLIDQDATYQHILNAVKNIFSTANSEDICLIYFSGHASNSDYNQNTIIPYDDFPDKGFEGISDQIFYQALQAANTQNCQVVFLLDTHTGYYKWVEERDIFLGGVRNTQQKEFPFGEVTSSAFLKSLKEILEQTSGKITCRDLYLWLNFKMEHDYEKLDENPVLLTSLQNLDTYFLTKKPAPLRDYFLVACNKQQHKWLLIPEDFLYVAPDSTIQIYDYATEADGNMLQTKLIAEEGNLFMAEASAFSDNQRIYKAFVERRALCFDLQYSGGIEYTDTGNIMSRLKNIRFGLFSNWGRLLDKEEATVDPDFQNLVSLPEYLRITVNEPGKYPRYQAGFLPDSLRLLEGETIGWQAESDDDLIETISLLSAYIYFLKLPTPDSSLYARLQVTVQFSWYNNTTPMQLTDQLLLLDHRSIDTRQGSVRFYPLNVLISNKEKFPLFYAVYLVLDDFTIKQVSGSNQNKINGEATVNLTINEQQLFDRMLSGRIPGHIKVLFSRDPLQQDFTQHRIKTQTR